MQLSKTFDYAVRALVHLGNLPPGGTADLRTIATTQDVPQSYLAKVMRALVRPGFVLSTVGRDGGYQLGRNPEEVSLLEVYRTIEGTLKLVDCQRSEDSCSLFEACPQVTVWKRLQDAISNVLTTTMLSELLNGPSVQEETSHVAATS